MTTTERPGSPSATSAVRTAGGSRRPVHVAVAIGLGTGVYAFSLATVTALQAETDRALIADREPVAEAIGLLADHHDGLAASLETARLRYTVATERYGELAGGLDALHAELEDLGASIRAVEGMRFSVPGLTAAIPRAVPGGNARPKGPTGNGATGGAASGGSASSGTSSGSSGSAAVAAPVAAPVVAAAPPPVAAPAPPPAAAPPATQGTTGASGAP